MRCNYVDSKSTFVGTRIIILRQIHTKALRAGFADFSDHPSTICRPCPGLSTGSYPGGISFAFHGVNIPQAGGAGIKGYQAIDFDISAFYGIGAHVFQGAELCKWCETKKTASSAKSACPVQFHKDSEAYFTGVPKNRTPIFHDVPKRQSETFNNLEKMNFQEQAITIQQVSQKLDIPKPTLRFWEREFEGILVPLRTNGGQRRYAQEHVSIIEEIKMLKKAGLSLVEIKRKLGKGQRSEVRGQRSGSMSKAGEQMSGAGSWVSGDERTDRIDLLAARVAEVVRAEVNKFFEGV